MKVRILNTEDGSILGGEGGGGEGLSLVVPQGLIQRLLVTDQSEIGVDDRSDRPL